MQETHAIATRLTMRLLILALVVTVGHMGFAPRPALARGHGRALVDGAKRVTASSAEPAGEQITLTFDDGAMPPQTWPWDSLVTGSGYFGMSTDPLRVRSGNGSLVQGVSSPAAYDSQSFLRFTPPAGHTYYTIDGWFCVDDLANWGGTATSFRMRFPNGVTAGGDFGSNMGYAPGYYDVYGSGESTRFSGELPTRTWHHVVMSYDRVKRTQSMWVNGAIVALNIPVDSDGAVPQAMLVGTFGMAYPIVQYLDDVTLSATDLKPEIETGFMVIPDEGVVVGWGWPPSATAMVGIDFDGDKASDFAMDVPVDSSGNFEYWGQTPIETGWTVNVTTQYALIKKTHTVRLEGNGDAGADTVSGVASPESLVEVYAWADEEKADPYRTVSANTAGAWAVDFGSIANPSSGDPDEDRAWNIPYGGGGSAYETDEDGDMTGIFWEAPLRSVYRFRNLTNGFYLWSADPSERAYINANLRGTWREEGKAYAVNPDTNTSTLMRFRNLRGGYYLYSADPAEWAYINANLTTEWVQEGRAYGVSRSPNEDSAVAWRFRNLQNGTYLYSTDPDERDVINETLFDTWKEEGEAYYLNP